MTISWVLGTLMLWIAATFALRPEGVFPAVFTDVTSVLCLLLVYACLSGLGFFAGLFTVLWLVLKVCRYINGAPFAVGDYATVLTGPRAGTVARVYELTVGQGGGLLPRLDLGAEVAAKYLDIFDDYSLLRQSDDGTHGISHTNKTNANGPQKAASANAGRASRFQLRAVGPARLRSLFGLILCDGTLQSS